MSCKKSFSSSLSLLSTLPSISSMGVRREHVPCVFVLDDRTLFLNATY